jgi:hypothetical protein
MAVTITPSDFIRYYANASSQAIVLPTDVPAGAAICVGILDRADSRTVSSISDPVNGTWASTERSAMTSGGGVRSTVHVLTNSAALTGSSNRTITVTMSAGGSYHMMAGWVNSSLGALTFDAAATVTNNTTNTTSWSSGTATSTGDGVLFGFVGMNNGCNSTPTLNSGETLLFNFNTNNVGTNEAPGSGRSQSFAKTYAGSGSQSMSVTLADANAGQMHLVALKEPGNLPSATTRYNSFAELMADGTIDMNSDTFKVCLVTSSYTPSLTHTQLSDVSANRVSGTTDVALTSVTWTRSGGTAKFDAADTDSLFSSTGTAKYAVIYSDTSVNDRLVGYVTLPDSTTITSGDTLRLVWDVGGIFTLA